MLWKRCRCGELIPQGMKECEKCAAKREAGQQREAGKHRETGQQAGGMSRHMEYNIYRRDKQAAAFYISPEWRRLRALILQKYDGLDPYAYAVQHRIMTADIVHHITELDEDWNRRLDPTNLIPLSAGNHGIISALYKREKDKKETQQLLYTIINERWKEVGGIQKVFCAGF